MTNEAQDYKALTQSFIDNHEDINEDRAIEIILEAHKQIQALREERKNDVRLQAAKEVVKALNSGYKAALAYEDERITFVLAKLEEIQSGQVNPMSAVNG